jgi:glutathione peroxidase
MSVGKSFSVPQYSSRLTWSSACIDRQHFFFCIARAERSLAAGPSSEFSPGEITMSALVYDIPVRKITGADSSLAEFKGKVLLVVNVASKCGLTKQYEGLEKLYEQYRDQGLVVAGFPANDFAGQEPGTNEEIQGFCTANFGVEFPLFDKITVVGARKHPLYAALIQAQPKAVSLAEVPFSEKLKNYGIAPNPEPEVLWNFEKFLVSRTGEVVNRFAPDTVPDEPALVAAIEAELAKS